MVILGNTLPNTSLIHANNPRYRIDLLEAKYLKHNPLQSPAIREINVYLPPKYDPNTAERYPVIYFLHGYGEHARKIPITSKNSEIVSIDFRKIPQSMLQRLDFTRFINYERIDTLIEGEKWPPFILVQPDGSLHQPNRFGLKEMNGEPSIKGSFYVDSPYSGLYDSYIMKDVINYIDHSYKTHANSTHRGLLGVSMGGYGALSLGIKHPDVFTTIAALSPADILWSILNWQLEIPFYSQMFGHEKAAKWGQMLFNDILDTQDLIFSNEQRLLPSIRYDKQGNIRELDTQALRHWKNNDIITLLRDHPHALDQTHIYLRCDQADEFGLAKISETIHNTLENLVISHRWEFSKENACELSPHILGIAYHVVDTMKFMLPFIQS